MDDQPTAIDLFSGVGGMSLGYEQAGVNVLAAFDNDPIHVGTYARNFPGTPVFEADLSTMTGSDIAARAGLNGRPPDILFGGPPCQGFSYGGRRTPGDPRNDLVAHFGRLVCELRPGYFALENVAGLTSAAMHHYLDAFTQTVRSAGYVVVEPIEVLNAADYGVPQRRHRVIVLGCRADQAPPAYPDGVLNLPKPTVRDAIGDLPDIDAFAYLLGSDVMLEPLGNAASEYAIALRQPDPEDLKSIRGDAAEAGLSGCMRTRHSATTRERFASTTPGTFESVSRFYRLGWDAPSLTLRAGSDAAHGAFTAPRPIHPEYPRCISVREAARLHGFPDWFAFHPTKWHGFRQIGNSVPPSLARAVADQTVRVIQDSRAA